MPAGHLRLRPRSQLQLAGSGVECGTELTQAPLIPLPINLHPTGLEVGATVGSPALDLGGTVGGGLTPNLPAGLTLIGERFWNARNAVASPGNTSEGKWFDDQGHTWPNVVDIGDSLLGSDLSAGQVAQLYKGTASKVGKTVFTGSGDSTSPSQSINQAAISGAGFNATELYFSYLFAVSLNWFALTNFKLFIFATHTPGTNANSRNNIVVHLRTASGSSFGDASTPLAPNIEVSVNTAGTTTQATATQQVPRGAATLLEGYLRLNTNGQNDGICQLWVNGVLAMNRTQMGYRGGSSPVLGGDKLYRVELYNSKGGPGTATVLPAAQRLYHGYTGLWAA